MVRGSAKSSARVAAAIACGALVGPAAATAQESAFAVPPRLEAKYGHLRALDARALERQIVGAYYTVLGVAFFADVEVDGDGRTLRLWLTSPELLIQDNFAVFADIADAFVAWCRCPGRTVLGFDLRHVGGRRYEFLAFEFNSRTGRSELRRR